MTTRRYWLDRAGDAADLFGAFCDPVGPEGGALRVLVTADIGAVVDPAQICNVFSKAGCVVVTEQDDGPFMAKAEEIFGIIAGYALHRVWGPHVARHAKMMAPTVLQILDRAKERTRPKYLLALRQRLDLARAAAEHFFGGADIVVLPSLGTRALSIWEEERGTDLNDLPADAGRIMRRG